MVEEFKTIMNVISTNGMGHLRLIPLYIGGYIAQAMNGYGDIIAYGSGDTIKDSIIDLYHQLNLKGKI